jgi:hypothetical protein
MTEPTDERLLELAAKDVEINDLRRERDDVYLHAAELQAAKRRAEEEREQFRSSLATTCGKLAVADSQASFYRHQLDLIRMAHPEWTASDLRELARAALTPQEQKK